MDHTNSVPPSGVGFSVTAVIEKMPSGNRRWRQACTMRRLGTRFTLIPVTSLSPMENVPPIFVLMTAGVPVSALCFRESTSRS
jgi:hypothetical protein